MRDDYPTKARGFPKSTALAEAQNWRCCYCGTRVCDELGESHPDRATIDHVIALAGGGPRVWSNEVIACGACNTGRGRMDATAYYLVVREHGRFVAQRHGWAWQAGEDIASAPTRTVQQSLRRAALAHSFIRAPQLGVVGRVK